MVHKPYLRCGEEHIVRYMSHSTGYNTQSNAGEDVGVVSLAGVEGASVRQLHLVERTPAGKDAATLTTERRALRKRTFVWEVKTQTMNGCSVKTTDGLFVCVWFRPTGGLWSNTSDIIEGRNARRDASR